ncbi:MAG: coproporphyrinogen dehydrogenase HemZ [Clostridia bacterium]|nr:coproporphyrinogen dehydrogenase HemZ [Clostridia bacterium]
MKLYLIGHSFQYELEKLIRIFLPFEKIEFLREPAPALVEEAVVTAVQKEADATFLSVRLSALGVDESARKMLTDSDEKTDELELAVLLYGLLVKATGYCPPWGILTGVRPAKLYARLCRKEGREKTERYFSEKLLVSSEKIGLCRETFDKEESIIALSGDKSFSLYLSIPFCPSRCSYCSFVSHSIADAKRLIPDYVALLCRELAYTAQIAADCGLQLETVYIGGGTPTAISAEQLDEIMKTVRRCFDLSVLREYTVEAGRPDTVTAEKLKVIKENGATRISINPQTMSDEILCKIGRKHTSRQTVDAFELAREIGFDNINMDLIAGLPSDTPQQFDRTIKKVLALYPESVTVHALSMKRSSTLSVTGQRPEFAEGQNASLMVENARQLLCQNGIVPYYMYRQSKTVGNLENVGYAKQGKECLYNVYIMDETHTILACGASAVTKLRQPDGDRIERIFNFKYPYEYIARFEELCQRKDAIKTFYEPYTSTDQ